MKIEIQRVDGRVKLKSVPLDSALDDETYAARLKKLEKRLQRIQEVYRHSGRTAIIVFEGWDAAGKGGTIRRIAWSLDPRNLHVWPIAVPTADEKAHHYLWRFWQRLPPHGTMAIFDRSWYGRVMVERVEGFATEAEWKRSYDEINDFERLLTEDGACIVKLFLHLSEGEQRRRLLERLDDPAKQWKLSAEDFRNRGKRTAYVEAIEEMLEKTSRKSAPWYVIASEDKNYGRIAALTAILDRLEDGQDLTLPPLDPEVEKAARALAGEP